ncbi:excisionase family DNA-binding protein [Nocardioides sp. NPDC051685]|uniref:excisionase family DNA-binding protein n=1 Tax=Nocardioides sp. NPDC051685 TaxID=3364334 RepID=UPI00379E8610
MARHPVEPAFGDLSAGAVYLGTSRRTIVRLVESGRIPVYRLGPRGNRRIKFSDLDDLLVVEEANAS